MVDEIDKVENLEKVNEFEVNEADVIDETSELNVVDTSKILVRSERSARQAEATMSTDDANEF